MYAPDQAPEQENDQAPTGSRVFGAAKQSGSPQLKTALPRKVGAGTVPLRRYNGGPSSPGPTLQRRSQPQADDGEFQTGITTRTVPLQEMSAAMVARFLGKMNVSAETIERVRTQNISGKVLAELSCDIQHGLQCLDIKDPVTRARIRLECSSSGQSHTGGNRGPVESRPLSPQPHAVRSPEPVGSNPECVPSKAMSAARATAVASVQSKLSEAAILQRTEPKPKPPPLKPAAAVLATDSPTERVRSLMGGEVSHDWYTAQKAAIKLGSQINVQVGYKIDELGEVDVCRSVFFMKLKIFAKWQDEALLGISTAQQKAVHKWYAYQVNFLQSLSGHSDVAMAEDLQGIQVSELFIPDLMVVNEHDTVSGSGNDVWECKVTDRKKGWVKFTHGLQGFYSMDIGHQLWNFPFDFHDLHIYIRARKLDKWVCNLVLWPDNTSSDCPEVQNEWHIIGHRAELFQTNPATSSTNKTYALFRIVLMVQRFHSWYVWNVFFFLAMIVLMSFGLHFLEADDIGTRVETCAGLVLSQIALKFVVAESVPRIRYLTLFDEYNIAIFLFLLAVYCEAFALHLIEPDDMDARTVLNMEFFIGGLVMWALYHLYLGQRLYRHYTTKLGWEHLRFDDGIDHEISKAGKLQFLEDAVGKSTVGQEYIGRSVCTHAFSEDRMWFISSADVEVHQHHRLPKLGGYGMGAEGTEAAPRFSPQVPRRNLASAPAAPAAASGAKKSAATPSVADVAADAMTPRKTRVV
jgi:hypothetical protein